MMYICTVVIVSTTSQPCKESNEEGLLQITRWGVHILLPSAAQTESSMMLQPQAMHFPKLAPTSNDGTWPLLDHGPAPKFSWSTDAINEVAARDDLELSDISPEWLSFTKVLSISAGYPASTVRHVYKAHPSPPIFPSPHSLTPYVSTLGNIPVRER